MQQDVCFCFEALLFCCYFLFRYSLSARHFLEHAMFCLYMLDSYVSMQKEKRFKISRENIAETVADCESRCLVQRFFFRSGMRIATRDFFSFDFVENLHKLRKNKIINLRHPFFVLLIVSRFMNDI